MLRSASRVVRSVAALLPAVACFGPGGPRLLGPLPAACHAGAFRATDPAEAGPDYAVQGEYEGVLGPENDQLPVGLQIVALGEGKFRAVLHRGGLPGAGWNRGGKYEAEGRLVEGRVAFEQGDWRAVWEAGEAVVRLDAHGADNPQHDGSLRRVVRTSPTLGAAAPPGAIVLFDGSSTDAWQGENRQPAAMSDGLLHPGALSRARFRDHRLHLEFRTPFQPGESGQARGNSGLYVDGRYEIQILDSFGLSGEQNECGGIFSIARPAENMCFPPLQWQTYDVDYTAPRYDEQGKRTSPALVTVRHNGVLIHERLELPRITPGNPQEEGPEPGPAYLQDHQNPVRFRNVWVAAPEGDLAAGVLPGEAWAAPRELRGKKMIGGGQCSLQPGLAGVGVEFLLRHPEFGAAQPFDGLTLLAPLDAAWTAAEGLGPRTLHLDELAWSTRPVPYAAVAKAIRDFRQVQWGRLTDNFLWYRMTGQGRSGPEMTNLADDRHWAVVERNAALAARVCREAGFKGFMLDTEQYGSYELSAGSADDAARRDPPAFPLGRDAPEVLRKRGRQWIRAVQAEHPDIVIVVFFGWTPDLETAGFLAGVNAFLDGVLEGIEGAARIVHGYENTFYYGHAAKTRFTEQGFPGNRSRYAWARQALQTWRKYSALPTKYDRYVEPGMAAWVESDPWDLWSGYPSGTNHTLWSNLPLALAYSDQYVWVWSEHTHYGHSWEAGGEPNPFLLSASNQTFNTGREAIRQLDEQFADDPLQSGWYFDFDMLSAGRKQDPDKAAARLSLEGVPYQWSPSENCLRIRGEAATPRVDQRRRFVRPVQSGGGADRLRAAFEFEAEQFGDGPAAALAVGLFDADSPLAAQSAALRIESATTTHVVLAQDGRARELPWKLAEPLALGTRYRFGLTWEGPSRRLVATLDKLGPEARPIAEVADVVSEAEAAAWHFDELGIALSETASPAPSGGSSSASQVRLHRAIFDAH